MTINELFSSTTNNFTCENSFNGYIYTEDEIYAELNGDDVEVDEYGRFRIDGSKYIAYELVNAGERVKAYNAKHVVAGSESINKKDKNNVK